MALFMAIVFVGCGDDVRPPVTMDGKLDDGAPVDASPCAAVDVVAGGDHTCALSATGALFCWGRGDDGQIGVDPLAYRCVASTIYCQTTPIQVAFAQPFIAVGTGAAHTCASTGSGKAYCWGKNSTYQYGDTSIMTSAVPKLIGERAGATAFDGGLGHTCSLASGTLACSGLNAEGQVGNASTAIQPLTVAVMNNVATVSLGTTTSCAIDTVRQLSCWGRNTYKTIDQTAQIKTVPTAVPGGADVVSVGVGADHVCAAFAGGVAKCWGLNNAGQIGSGMMNGNTAQPMTALSIQNVVEVSASRNHSCVRTEAGEVFCFGEGYTPTPMMIVTGATKLASGASHDCALLRDGSIRCWGDQTYGQLGNNVDLAGRATTPQAALLCR
jgi:alpha-tubulin suppressor-like RCC1 family protein